jgi:hypothetical protein
MSANTAGLSIPILSATREFSGDVCRMHGAMVRNVQDVRGKLAQICTQTARGEGQRAPSCSGAQAGARTAAARR